MSTDIQDETLHPTARKRPKPRKDKLPPGERLLGVREAAVMLGLKPGTLYQWAYERKIPVVKLFGRALRFRLSAIEKIIAVPSVRPFSDPTAVAENRQALRANNR